MSKPASLTPKQLATVDRARALAAISSADDEALAGFTGHPDLTTIYPAAFADAKHTIHELLRVIDELTGAAR